MALSAGTYRGRLGDRLYTTELPRVGELIGLRGLGIADPASENCIAKGGRLEVRGGGSTAQSGFCIFPDGSECEEWAFMRGTCGPGATPPPPGSSCGSLGPGYSDKCEGLTYPQCAERAGDNVNYQTRCAEAYGVPPAAASMLAFYAKPSVRLITGFGRIAGITLGVYHGVKRNNGRVWPGIGWGLMGSLFWPVVIPVILAQGVGKKR